MRVEWRPLAQDDLIEIVRYVASESPKAAYEIHDRIQALISALAKHPRLGRPGRVRQTRELVVTGTPFLAAYRVEGDVVTVLRVLHGVRQWPRKL